MMTAAAWRVASWPPLLWQAHATPDLQLVHLGTEVLQREPEADAESLSGQTLWGFEAAAGRAGMAWDWVCVGESAVALADPMALITNLWLLDREGQVLSPLRAAPHLNGIVHGLPWQDEVVRALERHAA